MLKRKDASSSSGEKAHRYLPKTNGGWDAAQWLTAHPAYTRPWAQTLAPKKGSEAGEMPLWLRHLLLLQGTWVWFPALT